MYLSCLYVFDSLVGMHPCLKPYRLSLRLARSIGLVRSQDKEVGDLVDTIAAETGGFKRRAPIRKKAAVAKEARMDEARDLFLANHCPESATTPLTAPLRPRLCLAGGSDRDGNGSSSSSSSSTRVRTLHRPTGDEAGGCSSGSSGSNSGSGNSGSGGSAISIDSSSGRGGGGGGGGSGSGGGGSGDGYGSSGSRDSDSGSDGGGGDGSAINKDSSRNSSNSSASGSGGGSGGGGSGGGGGVDGGGSSGCRPSERDSSVSSGITGSNESRGIGGGGGGGSAISIVSSSNISVNGGAGGEVDDGSGGDRASGSHVGDSDSGGLDKSGVGIGHEKINASDKVFRSGGYVSRFLSTTAVSALHPDDSEIFTDFNSAWVKQVCNADDCEMKLFLYEGWTAGELDPQLAVSLMTASLCQFSGTFPGGEKGGFWTGYQADGVSCSSRAWNETEFCLKETTLRTLCTRYGADPNSIRESTTGPIYKRFTQTGWHGNELTSDVVDFLCYRTAVILLLGRDYRPPPGEVPGTHNLLLAGAGEESEADSSDGDDRDNSNKRKRETGRKTCCCCMQKLEKGYLTK